MNIQKRIGQRIRQLRHELKLSQERLAYKAGVDRTYMTDVENGRRNVSIGTLIKIIEALDVSISEFFLTKEFQD